jgi:hypothetical protein
MRTKTRPQFHLLYLMLLANIGWAGDFAAGLEACNTGDYETALSEWTPLAEQGDARSQFGLGLLYANGWGVPQDDANALHWYELAASQGHAEAHYNIGVMYQNGWGVEQSDAEALEQITKAADGGFPAAHRALGHMYAGGMGVAQDMVQAYRWFETGAKLGDAQSGFDIQELGSSMPADEIATAKEIAQTWIEEFRASHPDYVWADD